MKYLSSPLAWACGFLLLAVGWLVAEKQRPMFFSQWVEAERDAERIERERLTDEAIKAGEPLDWSKVDPSKLGNLSTGPAPTDAPR